MSDDEKTLHIIYLRPVGWADWQIPIGAVDSDGNGYVAGTLPDPEDLASPERDRRVTVSLMEEYVKILHNDGTVHTFANAGGCIAVSRPYPCRSDAQTFLNSVLPGGIKEDTDE